MGRQFRTKSWFRTNLCFFGTGTVCHFTADSLANALLFE